MISFRARKSKLEWARILSALSFFFSICSCSQSPSSSHSLPSAEELGAPAGGYRLYRVITHMHSPYSWDACDGEGISSQGVLNASCLRHLRDALCENRIDFTFLTDHVDRMQDYDFSSLLLYQEGDTLSGTAGVDRNALGNCENGFSPQVSVGFESRLMALGMSQHLSDDIDERGDLYEVESAEIVGRLRDETSALVAIPHTESRSIELIQALGPDVIEIYNLHANLSPLIREQDLGLPPLEHLGSILTYLLDPWGELNPDYAFLHFFAWPGVYFEKWAALIASGLQVGGIVGSDSHENTFPQKSSDGERVDSHRRFLRWISNHVLATEGSLETIRSALRAGHSWMVVEALGSPVDFDFTAERLSDSVFASTGDTISLAGGELSFNVVRPSLHSDSPGAENFTQDDLILRLIHVGNDGVEEPVGSATGSSLNVIVTEAGSYRAEVRIVPRHLKRYLGQFRSLGETSYPWIFTNYIHVEP